MKVEINYEGTEIWVEEEVRNCLDELKREFEVRGRKNRRHEILWDSLLLESLGESSTITAAYYSIEDDAIKSIHIKSLNKIIYTLEELDKCILLDRFFYQMKYKELVVKYNMPDSSIETRIKRVLKKLKNDIEDFYKK